MTEQLIEARCNIDVQAKNGCSPLYCAAEDGHEAVTKELIKARSNIDLPDKDGYTAIHIAHRMGMRPSRSS